MIKLTVSEATQVQAALGDVVFKGSSVMDAAIAMQHLRPAVDLIEDAKKTLIRVHTGDEKSDSIGPDHKNWKAFLNDLAEASDHDFENKLKPLKHSSVNIEKTDNHVALSVLMKYGFLVVSVEEPDKKKPRAS
jgi:hypothetical protein|tara:strand:- start:37 stop:435 length:399 start_codon:yes stop_codon:yes gene_type:complete